MRAVILSNFTGSLRPSRLITNMPIVGVWVVLVVRALARGVGVRWRRERGSALENVCGRLDVWRARARCVRVRCEAAKLAMWWRVVCVVGSRALLFSALADAARRGARLCGKKKRAHLKIALLLVQRLWLGGLETHSRGRLRAQLHSAEIIYCSHGAARVRSSGVG